MFDCFSAHRMYRINQDSANRAARCELSGGSRVQYNRFSTVERKRIVELLAPFVGGSQGEAILSDKLVSSISTYIDMLFRWNARINLTAIRDPEQVIIRHFGESFFAASQLFPRFPERDFKSETHPSLADLGSGAGFPGIPIRLLVPDVSLTLIEANQKKAVFLQEVSRALELSDIKVENIRAETLSCTFDVVTLRAVEHFTEALAVAGRLVAPSGRLALLIGKSQAASVHSVLQEFTWTEVIPVPLSDSRVMLTGTRNQED
jgi:16S rRNA (guanine527-N7)-methyltransferase